MNERAPAFQFFPRQFSGDEHVMAMDLDVIGAHILLMCAAAASPERYRIHADERAIRTRLRNPSDQDWQRIKSQLLEGAWKLSEDGQWWEQLGLRRTFQKQKVFSDHQRDRALTRWSRDEANSVPEPCRTNAGRIPGAMPEECFSSSSSSSSSNLNTKSKPSSSEPSGSDGDCSATESDEADKTSQLTQLAEAEALSQEPEKTVYSEAAMGLAQYLADSIRRNNSKARFPANLNKWASDIDRMMRLDKRTEAEIRAVIDFAQGDSFWAANILSGAKLREKFDTLTMQQNRKRSFKTRSYNDLPVNHAPKTQRQKDGTYLI